MKDCFEQTPMAIFKRCWASDERSRYILGIFSAQPSTSKNIIFITQFNVNISKEGNKSSNMSSSSSLSRSSGQSRTASSARQESQQTFASITRSGFTLGGRTYSACSASKGPSNSIWSRNGPSGTVPCAETVGWWVSKCTKKGCNNIEFGDTALELTGKQCGTCSKILPHPTFHKRGEMAP